MGGRRGRGEAEEGRGTSACDVTSLPLRRRHLVAFRRRCGRGRGSSLCPHRHQAHDYMDCLTVGAPGVDKAGGAGCKSPKMEDACREYQSSLEDLTFNSKPHINMLTILAEENINFAKDIVAIIEAQISKVFMTTAFLIPHVFSCVPGAQHGASTTFMYPSAWARGGIVPPGPAEVSFRRGAVGLLVAAGL